jgi:hypothetical protein
VHGSSFGLSFSVGAGDSSPITNDGNNSKDGDKYREPSWNGKRFEYLHFQISPFN